MCVDELTVSDRTRSPRVPSHIFVGPDTQDTPAMSSQSLLDVGVTVFFGQLTYSHAKTKHPMSLSLVGPLFPSCLVYPKGGIRFSQGIASCFCKRGLGSRSGILSIEGTSMNATSL